MKREAGRNGPGRFGARGEWWVVGQVLILALSVLAPVGPWYWAPPWSWPWAFLGGLAASLGTVLMVLSFVSLGTNLRAEPMPGPGNKLVTRGPYRFIRHPVYTALCLLVLGFQCGRAAWLGLVWVPVLVVWLWQKALREEAWLQALHPDYQSLMARTGRFLPRFKSAPEAVGPAGPQVGRPAPIPERSTVEDSVPIPDGDKVIDRGPIPDGDTYKDGAPTPDGDRD